MGRLVYHGRRLYQAGLPGRVINHCVAGGTADAEERHFAAELQAECCSDGYPNSS